MPHPADRLSRRAAGFTPKTPRVPMSARLPPVAESGQRTRRRIRRWCVGVLLLAVLGWLAWSAGQRDWPQLRPQARTQTLLDAAAGALARGHLSAEDGSGARQLYAAVQAMNPDEPRARQGLAQVGQAALTAARTALARGDVHAAQDFLQLARELQVPRAGLDAVADAVREQALAQTPPEPLLERAEAARRLPDAEGAEAALVLYQQVLALEPGHPAAPRGRDEVLGERLDAARAQLRAGDLEAAAAGIALARRFDPGHVDLPDTVARFNEERAALRQQADALMAADEVTAALALWNRLLALDAGDAAARDGIGRAAQGLAERAAALAGHARLAEAEALLAQARELAPDAPAIATAERRIARAQAPDAAEHTRSLHALGECFDTHLAANDLSRARECLHAASAQGEAADTLAARRRQLALRWLAIAEERLGRGELSTAVDAFTSARRTDPATPGLDAFASRLEAAQP